MNDGDALLKAILANPDEDTPRLMYADYLGENGQEARAEFIRVQVELSKLPCHCWPENHPCSYCEYEKPPLRRREEELFPCLYRDSLPGVFVPNLDGHVGRDAPHAHYRRGFIESVTCTAEDWIRHADTITAVHPVRHVTLSSNRVPDDCHRIYQLWEERTGSKVCFKMIRAVMGDLWPGVTFDWPGVTSFPEYAHADFTQLMVGD